MLGTTEIFKMSDTCEFEHEGRKCTSKEIVGIARCKNLCKTHYGTVCRDNIRRFNKHMDIPKELVFTKKLSRAETWSFLNKDK